MCLQPLEINGNLCPCGQCWQCVKARQQDILGRCLAERATSADVSVITLTYKDPERGVMHDHADHLVYHDVQLYLTLLRRHGFPLRYFCVGEFGSKKGRAHWHIVLFWLKAKPVFQERVTIGSRKYWPGDDYPLGYAFEEKFWSHGQSYWRDSSPAALQYCLKYLQKAEASAMDEIPAQARFNWSRRPALGWTYFKQLAARYVSEGRAPAQPVYSFDDVRTPPKGRGRGGSPWLVADPDQERRAAGLALRGEPVLFWMRGGGRNVFATEFIRLWEETYPGRPIPPTKGMLQEENVVGAVSKLTGERPDWLAEFKVRAESRQADEAIGDRPRRARLARPWIDPPAPAVRIGFVETANTYACFNASGDIVAYWSFSPTTGERSWEKLIVSLEGGQRIRDRAEKARDPSRYRRVRDGA